MTRRLITIGLVVLLWMQYSAVSAQDGVQLVVTGSDRAIIILDGERLVLKAGEPSHPRVLLKEADSDRALIMLDGKPVELDPNRVAAPILVDPDGADTTTNTADSASDVVTLWADRSGMFMVRGTVNRRSTRFLVDTGADTVTFSSQQADQLGLDYEDGERGLASTASGVAPLKRVVLDRISIGGIDMRNIEANVILGAFPDVPLLGGSFLNKLSMVREGKKMELRKR